MRAIPSSASERQVLAHFHSTLGTIREHVIRDLDTNPNHRRARPSDLNYFDIGDLPDRLCSNLPHENSVIRLQSYVMAGCDLLMRRVNSQQLSTMEAGALEDLMRDLTGAWLGMYFLGVPFVHPWEPVARNAERNGYYGDAGMFKAAGDVYRNARKEWLRAPGPDPSLPEFRVLVLDHNPLAFNALSRPDGELTARSTVTALAACYEMLQMRLYIRSGGPIDHFVLASTIEQVIRLQDADRPAASQMWKLACRAYGFPERVQPGHQRIVILPRELSSSDDASVTDRQRVLGLSGCVLGRLHGVYRSRVREQNAGANGSALSSSQFKLYRRLLSFKQFPPDTYVLEAREGEETFVSKCADIAGMGA